MDQGSVLATLTAAGWAALASGALLVGAVVALLMPVNLRVIGAIMGFGAGVLIGAAAFELTAEAMATAGLAVSGVALMTGALVYLAGDWAVGNAGAHRRMSPLHGGASPTRHGRLTLAHRLRQAEAAPIASADPAQAAQSPPSPRGGQAAVGMVLVIGALLDGVPESAAIGISLLDGAQVGWAFLAAVFLSNLRSRSPRRAACAPRGDRSGRSCCCGSWWCWPPPSPQAWGMRCSATSARCFSAARRRSRRGPSWR